MAERFMALPSHTLQTETGYFRPMQDMVPKVNPDSPAILVMTDLRQVGAVTTEAHCSIAEALTQMKEAGVRLLLVVDADQRVLGLITSTDIQGEKPLQLTNDSADRFDELLVSQLMTPVERLEVVSMADVLKASVGNVVATLEKVSRRHALVLDYDRREHRPAIRGIFSATQVSKQLGTPIQQVPFASNFAETERALNH